MQEAGLLVQEAWLVVQEARLEVQAAWVVVQEVHLDLAPLAAPKLVP